ncbi:MAG: 1-acyl-sn-glycerol-3-phosphate acyltransferase [Bacillota bacterium]|nr:1-acyl-sn-glycerol-3-phosphate acyltransferase [Bacillota bacterium]
MLERGSRAAYLLAKAAGSLLLRLTGGVEVAGAEFVPRRGPLILVANHQSLLDPIALIAAMPREITFLAASYLFRIPLVGLIIRSVGAMPVHGPKADLRSLRSALTFLQKGKAIGLFPEGGVSRPGELRPFMPGWAYLALKSGAPVLPVILRGSSKVLPVGTFIPRPGRIRIEVLPPLTFAPKKKIAQGDLERLNAILRERFAERLAAK